MLDTKKQLVWSKLRVGVVITLALLTLLVTVFFAGGLQNILSPKVELTAQIHDAKGLRKGSPVWISGIEVGSVKSIDLDPAHGTLITLSVHKSTLPYIKKDSLVSVLTMGLLGDKYVELSSGSSFAEPATPKDVLRGTTHLELKDAMEIGTASVQRMSDFIESLQNLVSKIEKGEGSLAKFLGDPSLYSNLKESSETLLRIAKEFRESHGTMKKLLEDPVLHTKMVGAASQVENFGRKLNEGEGSLKKLVEDPALYDNLARASLQLSSILERIDRGEGLAGTLISDQELATELKETLTELKLLTQDIKEHPKKYFKFSLF